jgi:serine/threonine protein kinase/tetratricopeptide (TPR) repeat protein
LGLTIEQMARMSDLLDEAMELDRAGRMRWLENLSPQDRDLAQALREALFPPAEFLDGPAALSQVRPDGSGERPTSGLAPGRRVGPYELERLLGSGGMAEVWLAKRADGAFKREVALKLPMVSRMRKDLEDRLIRERDILASLEHPNIARLYDAGLDAQGLPYLCMEYVPGASLIEWCDMHETGIRARLTLFLQVFAAVQYAHEKQVIHRDLKPSNILVTESGEVRLLDFGVAKLLQDTDGVQLTHLYGRALTPDYASPEQLRGDSIDVRSDIYSLGVLLHELLAGQRPYPLKVGTSAGSLERAIAMAELQRPSTRLGENAGAARGCTQQRLAQELRGDLDVIILKALANAPDERYASAAAMAEDITRHLEHRPIQARPAPIALRVRKFIIRNRPVIAVSVLASVLFLAIASYEIQHRLAGPTPVPPQAFNPPRHSVAVLPFVNLSGDQEQRYFSDGLTEELLNSLTRINELQVAARTSSFSFPGEHPDIAAVGHKLNVASVLEGSVRRSGQTIRVSAKLIDAVTGFHLWSQTYDRSAGDLLQLQTDIADAVATALSITLLGDVAARIEVGGTRNPDAFDAYLRAARTHGAQHSRDELQQAIAEYGVAIREDPDYALALAARSMALGEFAAHFAQRDAIQAAFARAAVDAQQAIALAPGLAEGYLALAYVFAESSHDFARASGEYLRAQQLAPGNARVLRDSGRFAVLMGQADSGVAALRRAVVLDPLNPNYHVKLGDGLLFARRYEQAIIAFRGALALDSNSSLAYADSGLAYYGSGDLQSARKWCEIKSDEQSLVCLAVTLDRLGRRTDAQAVLAALQSSHGDDVAYQYAEIYAQWGNTAKSLQWLDTAMRLKDPGLVLLKVDPLIDPLRQEPRFAAIMHELKFPE